MHLGLEPGLTQQLEPSRRSGREHQSRNDASTSFFFFNTQLLQRNVDKLFMLAMAVAETLEGTVLARGLHRARRLVRGVAPASRRARRAGYRRRAAGRVDRRRAAQARGQLGAPSRARRAVPRHARGRRDSAHGGRRRALSRGAQGHRARCWPSGWSARSAPKRSRCVEKEPWRAAQVKGVGKRRAERAARDALARRQEREVMVFLQGLGVSLAYAARIRKALRRPGGRASVRDNPYRLARDVPGIGFIVADRIAQGMGDRARFAAAHPGGRAARARVAHRRRARLFPRRRAGGAGRRGAADRRAARARRRCGELARDGGAIIEGDAVYPPRLHRAEVELAKRIRDLLDAERGRAAADCRRRATVRRAEARHRQLRRRRRRRHHRRPGHRQDDGGARARADAGRRRAGA